MSNSNKKVLIPQENPPISYLNALFEVGLTPVCAFSPSLLSRFSGLLLTGGGDVFPPFYNGDVFARNINIFRDLYEFEILDYFVKHNLPVLGVCRGLQIINLYFGGTLKNVDGHFCSNGDKVHAVNTVNSGFLKDLSLVNSSHRQAVDKLCKNAQDVCFSTDGTVEGFSINGNILAVQFHPERMDVYSRKKIYGKFYELINKI
ncbi:MAG: hypothetical protein E7360_05395 [Clostridiales bacterium]|nr:hypothetical protein [Clostridiales bacterium]